MIKNSLVYSITSFHSAFPSNSRDINDTRKGVNHHIIIIHHKTTSHVAVSNNEQVKVFGAYIANDDNRWLIPLCVSLISLELLGKAEQKIVML